MDAVLQASKPIVSAAQSHVRLMNAGLQEKASGEIVAHGWIDITSMQALGVDDYQREVLGALTSARKPSIRRALEAGASLPDIMIGMRGSNYDTKGSSMILLDKCYIVDGLQRVSQMMIHAEANPEEAKHMVIGAEVRFNTTKASERDLFLVLNTSRIPVSPNVILRNLRETHPAILTLYGLTHSDSKFALYEKVCWDQRMSRSELLTALMLAKTARAIHAQPGVGVSTERAESLASLLDNIAKRVGLSTFRRNIVHFFDVVDECFGLRSIQYKEVAPQLKGNFLTTVGRVLASHKNFWEENGHLFVDALARKKLAAFAVSDPEVMRLSGAGTMAQPILYQMLVDHMNKGKRINHLKPKD